MKVAGQSGKGGSSARGHKGDLKLLVKGGRQSTGLEADRALSYVEENRECRFLR